jgi:hypothetical protein
MAINPQQVGTQITGQPGQLVPSPRQYLKIGFSTMRYRRLNKLSEEYGCSWERIALDAIDWYLQTHSPQKYR